MTNSVQDELDRFSQQVADHFCRGTAHRLVLAKPRRRDAELPRKQSVRPIMLRGEPCCHWELQFEKQQTHRNLSFKDTASSVRDLMSSSYDEAYLFAESVELTLRRSKGGFKLSERTAIETDPPQSLSHDRRKEHLIPEGTPCPFLIALDVMTPSGQVKKSRQKKFRQINRYLELVQDVADALPKSGPIRIVDFGCGLSYLTFAVHHLFSQILKRDVDMLGIDRNPQVISRCREIMESLNLKGLRFSTGEISDQQPAAEVDLAISLHACDTATDQALSYAVASGSSVILAAPCCQHELQSVVQMDGIEPLLRHGILRERVAAMATDALRAAALEAVGYRTQIVEFIDLEHTPKNLLIRAIRRRESTKDLPRSSDYEQLKQNLGVQETAVDAIVRSWPVDVETATAEPGRKT